MPNIEYELTGIQVANRILPKEHIAKYQRFKKITQFEKLNPSIINYINASLPIKYATGLKNESRKCYAHSVIQCLFHTAPLYSYAVNNVHQINCNCSCRTKHKCLFCLLINEVKSNNGNARELNSFFNSFDEKFKDITKENDVHEYVTLLLNKLESCEPLNSFNFIHSMFYGVFRYKYVPECRHEIFKSDPFSNISIGVNGDTVYDCLRNSFKKESFDNQNPFECSICGNKFPTSRKQSIDVAPYILLIHLKQYTNSCEKNTKKVELSYDLNLKEFTSFYDDENKEFDLQYRLYAYIVHIGKSLQSGHYQAFVKSNKEWLSINDERTERTEYNKPNAGSLYLLFYERVNENNKLQIAEKVFESFVQSHKLEGSIRQIDMLTKSECKEDNPPVNEDSKMLELDEKPSATIAPSKNTNIECKMEDVVVISVHEEVKMDASKLEETPKTQAKDANCFTLPEDLLRHMETVSSYSPTEIIQPEMVSKLRLYYDGFLMQFKK